MSAQVDAFGLTGAEIDVLHQVVKDAVWDGNIASKVGRNSLVAKGYAFHSDGFTYATPAGKELWDKRERFRGSQHE